MMALGGSKLQRIPALAGLSFTRVAIAGVVAGVLVAGCAKQTHAPPTSSDETASPPATVAVREAPVPDIAEPAEPIPEPEPPKSVVFPPPERRPPGFSVDPEKVVNMDDSLLRERLGEPTAVREDPPATIWTYQSGDCRLDIYLYQSLKNQTLRSLTYVLESTRTGVDPRVHCLRGKG